MPMFTWEKRKSLHVLLHESFFPLLQFIIRFLPLFLEFVSGHNRKRMIIVKTESVYKFYIYPTEVFWTYLINCV